MQSIFKIVLFIVGFAIIFLYIEFQLYNLGVLFWFIPLLGLTFMGINIFGPTETRNENNKVEHRVFNNLSNSKITELINPNNDITLTKDFINYTNNLTSLIFYYRGDKQIVTGVSLKNGELTSFSLIENIRKNYNLTEISQLKRINGYSYSWEKHKFNQNFVQIRDYFSRHISVNDNDLIRFRCMNCIYSWKLTDNLITNFKTKGKGLEHFNKYITLTFANLFLKTSTQKAISYLGIEKNYIVAFDFEKNEYRIYYFEYVSEFEILYS